MTNNELWLTWRGVNGDEQIWSSVAPPSEPSPDGPQWSPAAPLPGASSSHAPSTAYDRFNPSDHRLMIWKGTTGTQQIFGNAFSPTALGGPSGAFVATGRPGVAAVEGRIVIAWRDPNDDLVWAEGDRQGRWSDARPTGGRTSHGPAMVVASRTVFMVWKALDSEQIWWASLRPDATGWGQASPLPVEAGAAMTSDVPALTATGNGLAMAWKGVQADPGIWWSEWSGGGRPWLAPTPVKPSAGAIMTSHGPALTILRTEPILAWKGFGGDQRLWWSRPEGNGLWAAPRVVDPGINSFASPALLAFPVGTDDVVSVPISD